MLSLRNFWHFPKEVDYLLICVSTMHHLDYCQSCIIICFCFVTELHCTSSAFAMIPWFSGGPKKSTYTPPPPPPRVNNVVICDC